MFLSRVFSRAPSVGQRLVSRPYSNSSTPNLWRKALVVNKDGVDLLHDPLFNKGTAFTQDERDRLSVRGLLPPRPLSFETQADRIMHRYHKIKDPLEKFVYLQSLQDRNETLFYHVLMQNLEEMAPIVYTPTVGIACQKFSMIFSRARGMYFSSQDAGQMMSMIYNWPADNVDVIVVTDGSRILGLGDLGVNGMGIPVGKLSLYVAAGGIRPWRVLPITIDVGTNNPALRSNPMYLGLQQDRETGKNYTDIMDEFMNAVLQRWPKVLVQFEDFSNENAARLLARYRDYCLCFNDDIQGTGAVALAGIMNACRQAAPAGQEGRMSEQRIVVVGAGSAGLGVTRNLQMGMMEEGASEEDSAKNFWLLDAEGLLGQGRDTLPGQEVYARTDMADKTKLLEVVAKVKPTVLLGLSGCGGLFTSDVIKEMASHVDRPIIFPLSNPTPNAECTAEEAYTHTDGRCIFASGSPFDPVTYQGKTFRPSQGNNMFIFPGVGLAVTAVDATRCTDAMLLESAKTLANCVSEDEKAQGKVYPDVKRIREVSLDVGVAVARKAIDSGLATVTIKGETLEEYVYRKMYSPEYLPLVRQ